MGPRKLEAGYIKGHRVPLVRGTYLAFSGWLGVGSEGRKQGIWPLLKKPSLFAAEFLGWLLYRGEASVPEVEGQSSIVTCGLALVCLSTQILTLPKLDITCIFY